MSKVGTVAVVHISNAEVLERKHGDMKFRSQVGLLETADGEALRIEVSLPRDLDNGYPVGKYHIGGASFDKDSYGRPCFGKRGLYLVPVLIK